MKREMTLISGLVFLILSVTLNGQLFFEDRAILAGVDHAYGIGVAGGGASFCDFNGDGWEDLTIASQVGDLIAFYENREGTFVKIPPLIDNTDEVKQILWADIDNDGDKDLFITTLRAPNRLYENRGNMQLVDITAAAGLSLAPIDSYGACIGDFDRDGWLDIYVTQRGIYFPGNENFLYKNNGNGTFTDVTALSQTRTPGIAPFCASFFDLNNDLWPDIYIAQDRMRGNTLLRNNGNVTFSNISEAASANLRMDAMGIAVGDYNCDGYQDIYISNTPHGNRLLQNRGNETFVEVAETCGVLFESTAWGCQFFDADNDGWEDLYVSGMVVTSSNVSSLFYRNLGGSHFEVPDAGFVGDTVSSFGNAVGDFNHDGALDLIVVNTGIYKVQLWKNTGVTNEWLKLKLEGVMSNRDAIGVRVDLFAGGHRQMRYVHCGISFLGQNTETLHFGLNDRQMVDSVIITWPTGHVDRLYDIESRQVIYLKEGATTSGEIYVEPGLNTTRVTEIIPDEAFRVFPNPTSGALTIELEQAYFPATLKLWDITGRMIWQTPFSHSKKSIELPDLSSGIYFLTIHNGNKMGRKRIVVQ